MTEPMLYTPTEAAAALGIGRSKLYELLQNGVLESRNGMSGRHGDCPLILSARNRSITPGLLAATSVYEPRATPLTSALVGPLALGPAAPAGARFGATPGDGTGWACWRRVRRAHGWARRGAAGALAGDRLLDERGSRLITRRGTRSRHAGAAAECHRALFWSGLECPAGLKAWCA